MDLKGSLIKGLDHLLKSIYRAASISHCKEAKVKAELVVAMGFCSTLIDTNSYVCNFFALCRKPKIFSNISNMSSRAGNRCEVSWSYSMSRCSNRLFAMPFGGLLLTFPLAFHATLWKCWVLFKGVFTAVLRFYPQFTYIRRGRPRTDPYCLEYFIFGSL